MTTYSISLDEVDLALLPVRTRRTNDFLEKEHYQFSIMARDDIPTEPQLYKCHTCAVDVPAAYAREHCSGEKHRASARIAAAASRRLRSLVAAAPPPPAPRPPGRYCDSCAAVVSGDHDKTKEHRVAVIHDRMLVDLMRVYVGDDEDREDGGIVISDTDGSVAPASDRDVALDDATADSSAEACGETEDQVVISEEEHVPDIPNDTHADDRNSVKIDIEKYIQLLKVSDQPHIAVKAAGDQIQIFVNNEIVNVSSDNFHSYHRLKGRIQCRVCCETLSMATEDVHKLSTVHIERVSKVVRDSHCVRAIYDDWSHCIICNQVMKTYTVNAHKYTKAHYDRKREATSKMATGNDPRLIPSYKGTQNNAEIKPKTCNAPMDDKIEYPYKRTPNPMNVFCVVCNCDVPIKYSNRADHLKGTRHAYSLKSARNADNPPAKT